MSKGETKVISNVAPVPAGPGDWCKWVAAIAMTIDHASIIYPGYPILQIIGRIAFPLFAYFIALGAERTRSEEKYLIRLLGLALLAQIPYSILWVTKLNTLWTLSLGLTAILLDKRYGWYWSLAVILGTMFMQISYSFLGVGLVYGIWKLRNRRWELPIVLFSLSYALLFQSMVELWALLAIPVIRFPVALRKKMPKLFWYPLYPAQYAILALIKILPH